MLRNVCDSPGSRSIPLLSLLDRAMAVIYLIILGGEFAATLRPRKGSSQSHRGKWEHSNGDRHTGAANRKTLK